MSSKYPKVLQKSYKCPSRTPPPKFIAEMSSKTPPPLPPQCSVNPSPACQLTRSMGGRGDIDPRLLGTSKHCPNAFYIVTHAFACHNVTYKKVSDDCRFGIRLRGASGRGSRRSQRYQRRGGSVGTRLGLTHVFCLVA